MDVLAQHEIAEAQHRILNPITHDKLTLLGEICRITPDQRHLDLACGKGEMLCQWAQNYGYRAVGVDISEVFLAAARERAEEFGVTEQVRYVQADAGSYTPDDPPYDIVSCIGATWIGSGLAGTIALMRPAVRDDGLLLIGEPYWTRPPSPEACAALRIDADEFVTLPETLDRFEAAGTNLVEMVLASPDSWDRYVAAQWWTVDRWLRANPDHQDAPEMRRYLETARRTHLQYQRELLGWGVFVLRLA